jgi:hypothetical protein
MTIERVEPGGPVAADHQNRLIDCVNRRARPGASGAAEYGAGGVSFHAESPTVVALFELTQPFTFPSPTASPPQPVPSSPSARMIWLKTDDQQGDVDQAPDETLYHPTAFRSGDGVAVGFAPAAPGQRVFAWWSSQGGRWEVLTPPLEIWRFELKYDIAATSGTVAYLLDQSGSRVSGVEFVAYDPLGLHLWAKAGGLGYARWMPDAADAGRWEILHVMRKARFIRFTAGEDFTSSDSSFSATLADYWDGSNPDPAAAGLTIANTCASSGRYGDCGLARLDEIDNVYRLVSASGSSTLRWAKAQYDWSANSGDPRVEVKACDRDGTNETGDNFYVYLPRSTSGDPAVFQDAVIGYTVDVEGTCICVTDYMDDAIGTVKMWKGSSGDVPAGWRICDGSDDALDFQGRFAVGVNSSQSDEDAVGDTGGHRWHGDSENWHLPQDHPNHRHNLDTSNAISIQEGTGDAHNVWSADTDNWTSGADAVSGGDAPNWDHLGTYNSNLDTDNRPPFLAVYFIERYK